MRNSVGPLALPGGGVARLQEGTWRRRGRARWQRVDGRNVALSHILACWNLHFRAIGVFDQHAILIAPSVLDSADALCHRRPLPSAKLFQPYGDSVMQFTADFQQEIDILNGS